MAEFYVTKGSAESELQLHKSSCKEHPPSDSLRYVGSYASGAAAMTLAKNQFGKVAFCPSCLAQS